MIDYLAQHPCSGFLGYGPMMMWGGSVLLLVLGLAVVVAVVWLFSTRHRRDAGQVTATARSVLAERFARGEIGEEDYRRQLDVLG